MSYYLLIAGALLTAFILQFLFSMGQMKGFNVHYGRLRKIGRVAIGKSKGGFHAGAMVMFAIDKRGMIKEGCFMRGFTIFARFKKFDDFNGKNVGLITKEDCKGMEYSLRRSVLNAASNYNTIMDGGEVVETPGLLTRIADMLLGKSRKACK